MIGLIPFIVIVCIIVLTWLIFSKDTGPDYSRMPPSSPRWPIIGNMHLLFKAKALYALINSEREKLGNVFTIWFGSHPMVIAADQDSIREMFVQLASSTSDRPCTTTMAQSTSRGGKGLALANLTKKLTITRRECINAIRDLFTNKNPTEMKFVEQECTKIVKLFAESCKNGKSLMICDEVFQMTTIRIVGGACLGAEFVTSEENVLAVKDFNEYAFKAWSFFTAFCVTVIPSLQHLPILDFDSVKKHRFVRDSLLEPEIARHRELLKDKAYVPCCIIDHLLLCDEDDMDDDERLVAIHDIIVAGTETVGTTMQWVVFCLITHPEWQKRIHKELDAQISSHDDLKHASMTSFPYVRAFFHEVQRWSPAVAVSVPHAASEDMTFRGYRIPKGTTITGALHGAHLDENYWPRPLEFDPGRFITDEGEFLIPNKAFVPYSVGPRSCAGDALAKREMFFITLYIMYHLRLKPEVDNHPPPCKPVENTSVTPGEFKIKAEVRVPI